MFVLIISFKIIRKLSLIRFVLTKMLAETFRQCKLSCYIRDKDCRNVTRDDTSKCCFASSIETDFCHLQQLYSLLERLPI